MRRRRNSLRWWAYDYTTPGLYYVTLCVQDRRCLFGSVVGERMQLNAAGDMVVRTWQAMPTTFASVLLGDFVLMPNHFHGIVGLKDVRDTRVRLGTVIQWFKSRTTLMYGKGVRDLGWPPFDRRLWQRGFFDRVLRDEDEHAHASGYMARNPLKWDEDPLHP